MKRESIGLLLVLMFGNLRAQILGGVFSQGSTELKDNTAQIAALQALGSTIQEGDEQLENELDSIDDIFYAEYTLHQSHYGSFATVKPVVSETPSVAVILERVKNMVADFGAALDRWKNSGELTALELEEVEDEDSRLLELGVTEVAILESVLTSGNFRMTDAERLSKISEIDIATRNEYAFMEALCFCGDELVANRRKAKEEGL